MEESLNDMDWKVWEEDHMKLAKQEKESGWDLEEGSLIRMRLGVKMKNPFLLLNIHHILKDEWSGEVMRKQIWKIYKSEGKICVRDLEVKGQFYEFGEWEASVLEKEGEELREWWKDNLCGVREATRGGGRN